MADITQTYIPSDIWTLIGLQLGHEEAKKLKFVSKYFNNPALQNTLWQPYLNALHKMDNTIPYNLQNGENAQQIFIDGFKKIQERQLKELKILKCGYPSYDNSNPALYQLPEPTTLADLIHIDAWLNETNTNSIKTCIANALAKKDVDHQHKITRIPKDLKESPDLHLFFNSRHYDNRFHTLPIEAAIFWDNIPYAQELIELGVNVNEKRSSLRGKTLIEQAVYGNHINSIKLLIENGAKIDTSILDMAVCNWGGFHNIVKYLLTIDEIKNHKDTGKILAGHSDHPTWQRHDRNDRNGTKNPVLSNAQYLKDQEFIDTLLEYPEVFNEQPYLDQAIMSIQSYLYQSHQDKNKKRKHEEISDSTQENDKNNNSNKKPKK